MVAAVSVLAAGCGGISASKTVSPLDFLLPGMGSFLKTDPASTNAPVALIEISTEVAAVK